MSTSSPDQFVFLTSKHLDALSTRAYFRSVATNANGDHEIERVGSDAACYRVGFSGTASPEWRYGIVMGYRFVALTDCYADVRSKGSTREIPLVNDRFLFTNYRMMALNAGSGSNIMELTASEVKDLELEISQRITDNKRRFQPITSR